jgi:hypothetical protein
LYKKKERKWRRRRISNNNIARIFEFLFLNIRSYDTSLKLMIMRDLVYEGKGKITSPNTAIFEYSYRE